MKVATSKLSCDERRAAIIKAVRCVFADKGFDGTTTRELAEAAGVSEALLFKHFPNKQAIYSAMLVDCCSAKDSPALARLKALEPSASSLVILIHWLITHSVEVAGAHEEGREIQHQLLLRSLLEDGEFARLFVKHITAGWLAKLKQCLEAAIADGEAAAAPVQPELGCWFVEHITVVMKARLRPDPPILDYGMSNKQLVEQAVWFSLRGMGLSDEIIRRYYNPKALRLLQA